MDGGIPRAASPFDLAPGVTLRNRIVGTAHGAGLVVDGLAQPADAEYWRRRAAGGAAMLIVGGTVTAAESTWRRRIVSEAWREEAVPGMALRAQAIREEGAVAACQLVHLGRETTGAEMWFAPVGPSAVRSPREPVAPRALTDAELDEVVEGFAASAGHAAQAGFQVVELHGAHGYLLAQFLSPLSNLRPGADSAEGRAAIVLRIIEAIRAAAPGIVVGIRLSLEGGEEAGLTEARLAEVLAALEPSVDYVNLTVGVRTTYVKDMATEAPPLLEKIGSQIRPLVRGPLIVSQAFRRGDQIERALAAGADLVGMARPLIADPDFPIKLLSGREAKIRPCVSCNEDCRAFDPQLLCSVNPTLAPPGHVHRPAKPLRVNRAHATGQGPVAIVGAGPAGLECTSALAGAREVVLFDERAAIGGELAVAAAAPHRRGWQALLEFYASALDAADVSLRLSTRVSAADLDGYGEVVLAVGSEEIRPALPGSERAVLSSAAIAAGPERIEPGSRVLIVDDGFGSWRTASAVELAVAAGARRITLATPSAAFGASLPAEGRAQLLPRLRGAPLEVRPLTALEAIDAEAAQLRNVMSGAVEAVAADTAIVVGERRPRDWSTLVPKGAVVHAIGDAVVPRRVGPAISEGHALAVNLAAAAAHHEMGAAV